MSALPIEPGEYQNGRFILDENGTWWYRTYEPVNPIFVAGEMQVLGR